MKNGKLILLVEDDPFIRAGIKTHLEANGYLCIEASDGGAAIELARSKQPDLILLDVMMPTINGYQVCKSLKGDPKFKSIPILMLSAQSEKEDKEWGEKLGADGFLSKPIEFKELDKHIKRLLNK